MFFEHDRQKMDTIVSHLHAHAQCAVRLAQQRLDWAAHHRSRELKQRRAHARARRHRARPCCHSEPQWVYAMPDSPRRLGAAGCGGFTSCCSRPAAGLPPRGLTPLGRHTTTQRPKPFKLQLTIHVRARIATAHDCKQKVTLVRAGPDRAVKCEKCARIIMYTRSKDAQFNADAAHR